MVVLAGVGTNFLLAYLLFAGVLLANGIPEISTVVDEVVPTLEDGTPSPSSVAGLIAGDRIMAIDGEPTPDWRAVATVLSSRPGEAVTITVERGGETLDLNAVLASRVDPQTDEETGFLGVAPSVDIRPVGFFEAAELAGGQLGMAVGLTFDVLGRIVQPETLARLAGVLVGNTDVPDEIRPVSPIGIGQIGAQVDELGLTSFLILLASVNVMLATLNVLPLYPLDGGHFAVALFEKVTGRQADVRLLAPVAALVIALVGFLGLVAIILDIVNPINL